MLILGCMYFIVHTDYSELLHTSSPTLILGFLLLSAYCIGFLLENLGLPRITGYILAGLFLGPHFLNFYNQELINKLGFLNNMALAFIAFCAGSELKYSNIKNYLKSILYQTTGVTLVVFTGVTLTVLLFSNIISFISVYPFWIKLSIASIFGVISVARSPSSTIAVISETKAKGHYTDTILSVTIATDVIIIMCFAVVVSICQSVITQSSSINILFVLDLLLEIIIAFILGFLLGKAIVFLIDKVKVEFTVVIIAMGFFVIKFSHLLGDYLNEIHDISLNLEPLLICMMAGYTVQNFSKHGDFFLSKMDNVSLPIYVAFFAITGASINITILQKFWALGLLIVVARIIMLFIGSFVSGKLAKENSKVTNYAWLGFITQAGVSLGLLSEVARRFPEIGLSIQSILVAAITLNQIIGPITLKLALKKVGETKT